MRSEVQGCRRAENRGVGVVDASAISMDVPDLPLRATEAARALGADGIVSFGGGTPNDTGKAVVLALAENFRTRQEFDANRVKFTDPASVEVPPVRGAVLPMIAVSTTLSGSEFTHFAGITDEQRKVKDLYIDPKLAAKSVFLDPEMTLHTPLWLSTGMRAVDTHSVRFRAPRADAAIRRYHRAVRLPVLGG